MADRMTTLFFELFEGLPRRGPGDEASTRRALALLPGLTPGSRILDVGCGTGPQTIALARHSPARIVAVDSHPPFVAELRQKAEADGLADRIEARVGDMRQLDLLPQSFDVIWCEGAIYVMGFTEGLRAWRTLLQPGGHLAVTDACWRTTGAPAECAEFWEREYPAIRDVATRLRSIGDCGYETIGHFPLPAASWWDDYYRPLQENVTTFRARHAAEPDAQELADQVQREIDIWHKYAAFYGYEFFVMRTR